MGGASFVEGGVESGLHLGFIVDGNRRWAKERGLPTLEGHRKGLSKIEEAIEFYAKSGEVGYLSFFVFSTENWGRSEEEVAYLMKLLGDKIEKLAKKARKEGLRLMIMGSEERVEEGLMRKLRVAEELTADETGMRIILCFNYGGQQEIAEAARKLCLKKSMNATV